MAAVNNINAVHNAVYDATLFAEEMGNRRKSKQEMLTQKCDAIAKEIYKSIRLDKITCTRISDGVYCYDDMESMKDDMTSAVKAEFVRNPQKHIEKIFWCVGVVPSANNAVGKKFTPSTIKGVEITSEGNWETIPVTHSSCYVCTITMKHGTIVFTSHEMNLAIKMDDRSKVMFVLEKKSWFSSYLYSLSRYLYVHAQITEKQPNKNALDYIELFTTTMKIGSKLGGDRKYTQRHKKRTHRRRKHE